VKRLGLILFSLASAALADSPKPSVVLVHGAFADGSSWAKVIPILQAKGYNVTAVQNPLASFADDVAATNRAIAAQTGPVILVGHSWGGVVIMEAGVDPKVVGARLCGGLRAGFDRGCRRHRRRSPLAGMAPRRMGRLRVADWASRRRGVSGR
jgi:pimeloyl-ACP methyl ester carboxylesterase